MPEYFIHGNTFAAPFISEPVDCYVVADTPEAGITTLVGEMRSQCPLYAAIVYRSADDYHKGRRGLLKWLSHHAAATVNATSVLSRGPGDLEVDGRRVSVADPYGGTCSPDR